MATRVGVIAVAVEVGEEGTGVDVAGSGVDETKGDPVGVSVTADRGTIVGVDEAAAAPLKARPQPLNTIKRLKNKPIRNVFLIIYPQS
ncbi:MAG: hypothetical protein DPW09_11480 [Anaerolineae bacterium]|nr:hypothetical protein [Anaerolineae bacterium]